MAIADPQLQRISFFTNGARFIRSMPFPISGDTHGEIAGFAVTSRGPRIWTTVRPLDVPRPQDDLSFVWGIPENARAFDSLLSFEGPQNIVIRSNQTFSRIDAPFRRRPWVAFRADTMIVGNSDSPTFRVYDVRGRLTSRFDVNLPVRQVRESHRKQYADSVRAAYFSELERMRYGPELRRLFTDRYTDLMNAAKHPRSWQLYDLATLDEQGTLWLALPAPGRDFAREWRGIRRDGTTIARIRVPHRGSVVAAHIEGGILEGGILYVSEFDWPEQIGRVAAYRVSR